MNPGPPWIGVFNHKNGTVSSNTIVRNNIATNYNIAGGVNSSFNMQVKVSELMTHFMAPFEFDFHLLPGSSAVNAGTMDLAPGTDLEGAVRPQGGGIDLGAYER